MKKEKIKISVQTNNDDGWVEEYVFKGKEEMEKVLKALNKLKLKSEDD